MAFINKILGVFLGNKADKDMAEIAPLVELIKKEYERIKLLSSDELRAESAKLKALIQERIKPEEDRIAELKELVETVDIQESENIYQEIDKLEEKIDDKLEEVLNTLGGILGESWKDGQDQDNVYSSLAEKIYMAVKKDK